MSDEMLVKYLLGEVSPRERSSVQAWLEESAANRKYFDDYRLIWDESKKLEGVTTISTEAAWDRFQARIAGEQQDAGSPPVKKTIPLYGLSWMKAAAAIVLLVGTGWLLYTWSGNGSGQMLAQSFDKVATYTLPDGSTVTLNKNSELSYPAHFEGNTRSVALKGEAFFNITPNKSKPFIIDAGNSSVTVVGTSFNVKSRPEMTEVIVETGVVEVAKNEKSVRLTPGQKATVTPDKDAPVAGEVTDHLYNYYRTNEFVCNGVPLYKVVETLNDAYGLHIVFGSERLKTLPLTATFPEGAPDMIVDVIAKTFRNEMVVERRGSEIVFKER
ncbi:MAG: FecR domain-containing protein [Taibaiella sp.]|nr:FecR domain-containing protein [Taibaiella sp.]